ncbi:MAG: hypothetical protein Q9P01_10840, partial [Anaerolineae bacterium]|nr:hypothetical protein [Anaerolineae bacterium]
MSSNRDVLSSAVRNNIYDVAYISLLRDRLTAHTRKVTAIAISQNALWLATGSEDGTVILWNIETHELVVQFNDHRGPINSLAFSNDSSLLASAATDALASIWNMDTLELEIQ